MNKKERIQKVRMDMKKYPFVKIVKTRYLKVILPKTFDNQSLKEFNEVINYIVENNVVCQGGLVANHFINNVELFFAIK